jgi:DNA-binding Xre family transcriptional regulator
MLAMQVDALDGCIYMAKKLKNRVLQFLTEKEVAERRRIKVAEIAHAIDVSPHTVAKWINEDVTKIDEHVLLGLCDYFGCEFYELLYVEETDDDS